MTLAAAAIDENLIPIVAILSVFVGSPLAIAYARVIWRRATEPHRPAIDSETRQQLLHMQQSIDAMAIEVERISEGQRFVTRVLAERQPASALPAGEPSAPAAPKRTRNRASSAGE